MNDAAIRAASLTIEEFATLSLVYLIRYTTSLSINSVAGFEAFVRDNLMPFVPNVTDEGSSLWHIEAQNCGRLATREVGLRAAWVHNYGGVLGHGFTLEQAQGAVDPAHASLVEATLIRCLRDNSMFQPNATSQEVYLDTFKSSAIPEAGLRNIWTTYENSIPSGDGLIAMLEPNIPGVRGLYEKWENTRVKSLELNSVGIAVGHANAARVINLDAPLSIWIR